MAVTDIQIRPTRPDHPEVVALLDALDTYLASLYAPEDNHILDVQALLAPQVHFVAAWQGGRIVGCGAVRRMPGERDTADRPYGEIKRMYVDPAVRGQRLAERLLDALEQSLPPAGVGHALLETGRDQHAAVRLYERCGYRRRGPFGGYPDNGLSVFYEKQVSP
ncbi:GNAT family N-acetyltransferase [Aquincola sp. MAHUQ-54]|uniref:GNAT family N-acetyltransferase n=1 Tax=Aquincola agrisoli TaxID=3119538 RepID=A0AAW9QKJ0_9BURK